MKIDEHKLWRAMNDLNFIKEYLKENSIEQLPDCFYELLDESIKDVENFVKKELNTYTEKEVDEHFVKKELNTYTEKEVDELLRTQRGNCYVAILTETRDKDLASIAGKSPEPSGGKWRKWKNFEK